MPPPVTVFIILRLLVSIHYIFMRFFRRGLPSLHFKGIPDLRHIRLSICLFRQNRLAPDIGHRYRLKYFACQRNIIFNVEVCLCLHILIIQCIRIMVCSAVITPPAPQDTDADAAALG